MSGGIGRRYPQFGGDAELKTALKVQILSYLQILRGGEDGILGGLITQGRRFESCLRNNKGE